MSIDVDAAVGPLLEEIGKEARTNGREDASGMRRYVVKCMASNDFFGAGRAMGCDAKRAREIYSTVFWGSRADPVAVVGTDDGVKSLRVYDSGMHGKAMAVLMGDDGVPMRYADLRTRMDLARGIKAMVIGGIVKPQDIGHLAPLFVNILGRGGPLTLEHIGRIGEYVPGALDMAARCQTLTDIRAMIEARRIDAREFLSSFAVQMIDDGLDAL
jgi:hypothetical protein